MVNKAQDSSSVRSWNSQSKGEADNKQTQLYAYIQIMTHFMELKQIPREMDQVDQERPLWKKIDYLS